MKRATRSEDNHCCSQCSKKVGQVLVELCSFLSYILRYLVATIDHSETLQEERGSMVILYYCLKMKSCTLYE